MLIKLNNKIVCIYKYVTNWLLKKRSKWKLDRNTVWVILRKPFAQRIAKKRVNETSITSNRALRYILCLNYFEAICFQPFQFARCYHSADKPFVTLCIPNNLPRNSWMNTWELISKRESKCETRLIPLTLRTALILRFLHNNTSYSLRNPDFDYGHDLRILKVRIVLLSM